MVPRRRDALKNLDKKLKALAKKLPAADAFFENLFSLQESSHRPEALDRMAAIAAVQFLDYAMQRAIKLHLKEGISEPELKEFFDGPGAPLGNLSAKIAAVSALGIVGREDVEDLDTVRNIRNAFAHSMTHIKFDDDAVQKLCLSLHGINRMDGAAGIEEILGAKNLYVAAVGQLYFKLITYLPGS